jgi:very-short-patch-repair endonuclease
MRYMIVVSALIEREGGLLLARNHRPLKSSLSRWVQKGILARPMRGVYAHPDLRFEDRIAAVGARIPGGVVSGEAAIALTMHPDKRPGIIEVCTPTHRMPQRGYRFVERRVPADFVLDGVMHPVMCALDRAKDDAEWIDELVRDHQVSPRRFAEALDATPCRAGNVARKRRIRRTMTRPYSALERRCHDELDRHRIKGWVANKTVYSNGRRYELDIAFEDEHFAIELDGYQYHSDLGAFEADRIRQNDLVLAGWTVIRFTWSMMDDSEYVVNTIRAELRRLRRDRHKVVASTATPIRQFLRRLRLS